MTRRLISFAAIAVLTLTACGGGSSPAPVATPLTAAATAQPTATAAATAEPTPAATPTAETVATAVVDANGSDALVARIPAGWIVITARDIADEAAFAGWLAAHPEVGADSARSVAESMATGGVALFAFDAENAVGGFTPNLNATWVDSPVGDFEPWLADQAAATTSGYGLTAPLEYQAWTPDGGAGVSGFVGVYRYSMQDVALAGSQMIVPMADGRAAVLTFTCRDEQTDHFGPIVEALYTTLAAGA